MATFPPMVRLFVDGDPANASTTNIHINQLIQRTDWLKDQLEQFIEGKRLILPNQQVESGLIPGTPVYMDTSTDVFRAAQAKVSEDDANLADPETFWQGIILTVSGTTADIALVGAIEQDTGDWDAVFEDGSFASGDVFLSAVEAGKITTERGTLGVYIGHMRSTGELLIKSGAPGAFLDHVHFQRLLQGEPAGTVTDPAFGDPHAVDTPDSNEQGWLPANSTYFPGFVVGVQIPTGAKFGYNIQHPDEEDLREIFPVLPADNAQFSQGGAIVDTSKIVINEFGIWWLDNTYGNAPWPVDFAANGVATDILLWSTRIIAQASFADTLLAIILNELASGEIDNIAVSSILSGASGDLEVTGTEGDAVNGFQGQVTVTNKGVTAQRHGRGLIITAPSGNNTTGFKGLLDIDFDADIPAQHIWTELTGGGDKVDLFTTNGVNSGTSIGLRAHVLGSDIGNDFIDFMIHVGQDLISTVDYEVTIRILGGSDTAPLVTPVLRDVNVSFYRMSIGSPASDTTFVRTEQFQVKEGAPGELQRASVGPFADVFVNQNDSILVRFENNNAGNPLPAGTFRLLQVLYDLNKA